MSVELLDLTKGYIYLSTDTKPTAPSHDLLYETDTGIHYVWNGSAWVTYSGPINVTQARNEFIGSLLTILGDTRFLWLPNASDTTTSTDQSLNGRTVTYDATIASRLSRQGKGYKVSFNGTSQYGSSPDVANLSFGDASNDSAFSVIALANVTNTAASRVFVCKYAGSAREWLFQVNSSDNLLLALYDESVDIQVTRTSDAVITQGSMRLFGASYAGTGGSTAMNGATLYQDGLLIASTASNNASYVAMEDTAAVLGLGALSTLLASFYSGDMALVAVCQKNLSASDHWAIRQLCNGYFGFLA